MEVAGDAKEAPWDERVCPLHGARRRADCLPIPTPYVGARAHSLAASSSCLAVGAVAKIKQAAGDRQGPLPPVDALRGLKGHSSRWSPDAAVATALEVP